MSVYGRTDNSLYISIVGVDEIFEARLVIYALFRMFIERVTECSVDGRSIGLRRLSNAGVEHTPSQSRKR